jgi:acid phosphatase type 7
MNQHNGRSTGFWRALCVVLAISACHAGADTTNLINFGSPWRYHDFGTDPGANWFTAGYGDGTWKFNFSPFGYGEAEQTETAPATTTYFRMFLTITNLQDFSSFTLRLLRDDGAAVYVNGSEVLRDNLPEEGLIIYDTLALSTLNPPEEASLVTTNLPVSLFAAGVNLIAVEVHQAATDSEDMNFNLELAGTLGTNPPPAVVVVRGPYLQVCTSSNITVRWRTSTVADTLVQYGTNLAALNQFVSNATPVIDHEIKLPGLLPDTKYFYAIGMSTQLLAGDASYHFVTTPLAGTNKPARIWAIGDFGTGFPAQAQVRDAFVDFTGGRNADVWLMLGDNAYANGLDPEYQSYVFNVYPELLRRTVVWPTIGNHETAQNQILSDDYDYYRIFTMPTNGEAGGVPSGTEHYYSYDYANIHFVCLDSMTAIYRQQGSAMLQWLQADLADTTRDWIIAYFHHPAYTKGSHDSDLELDLIQTRENVVPILEFFGVDLILSGHSHAYERSYLIDGFYGNSSFVQAANFVDHGDGRVAGDGAYLKPAGGAGARRGMVYVVNGSSGGQGGGGTLNHPAMFYSVLTPGSLIIDVDGRRLDGTFLSYTGSVNDSFTIIKDDYPGMPAPTMSIARSGTNAVVNWPTSLSDYRLESAPLIPAPQWSAVTTSIATNGRNKSVVVPAHQTNRFFRLRRLP